jgi:hypothetical protein
VGALAAFGVLRDRQVSLPDPYNNPYTDWSTGFLCSAGALWLLGSIWTVIRARQQRRVPALVVVWLVLAALLVMGFFIGMMAFVSP